MNQWILISIVALWAACSSAPSSKKGEDDTSNSTENGATNGGTNGTTNSASDDDKSHWECPGVSFSHDGECVLPQNRLSVHFGAVEGHPPEWKDAWVCRDVLADEDVAMNYISGELVAETENCRVVYQDPAIESYWGYATGRTLFGDITVSGGGEVHDLFADGPFEGCRTTAAGVGGFVEFDTEYELTIDGGEDAPAFQTSLVTPTNPRPNCPTLTPGEPVAIEWTAGGADDVEIEFDVGNFELRCSTADTGTFIIPASLTSHLPEDLRSYLWISKSTLRPTFDADSDTWIVTHARASYSCFGQL